MDDLISRQDVLALAKDVTLHNGCKHRCIDASMIHELPSAESEIIRCKDCRHWLPRKGLCEIWEWYISNDAFYCGCGERRTDE